MTVVAVQRKFRGHIPEAHCGSLDSRLAWLWHQRFGTVQTIWQQTRGSALPGAVLDHTACTLILQAILGKDLATITQLFQRLEGGSLDDTEVLERASVEQTMRV